MKHVDDETREILESFIAEAFERLDDAEAALSASSCEADPSCLGTVFRLFHSVKGSAAFLELNAVRQLTHEAETLLDAHLKGGAPVIAESLDVIYETIDLLRELVKTVQATYTDEGCDERVAAQIAAIRSCIGLVQTLVTMEPGLASGPAAPEASGISGAPAAQDNAGAALAEPDAAPGGTEDILLNEIVLNELVTRDMTDRFLAETVDLIDHVESDALGLLSSGNAIEDVHAMFRAMHTIKGNAGFFGYALLETLCMRAESHLDLARKGSTPINEAFINASLYHVDTLRRVIKAVAILSEKEKAARSGQAGAGAAKPGAAANTAAGSGSLSSDSTHKTPAADGKAPAPAAETPATAGTAQGADGKAQAAEPAQKAGGDLAVYRPIGEILVEMGAAEPAAVAKALELQEKPLGELLIESGATTRESVSLALEKQRTMESKLATMEPVAEEVQRREIRVDTVKLDKLFDLVGELITAEAMVVNSPDLRGLKLDHFERAYSALNKISREIQETAMAIRMIPMDGIFHKMTRLVRDLSRKFGKPVDFRVSGQDTEMDKNVIEQISDPLVHILRNSIDHGLEYQDERKAAGKPETGSISLNARYEGSEIWVSIRDDGKGLNRQRVLAKAAERGLLKSDPDTLEDKDVWDFIFEPGFSTAQTVSDVSGRGVGLDVVRKNLTRIRGTVDVRSEQGKYTEFVLKIPLTMAIIDGITVKIGSGFYSIPLSDILEFFKARPGQITRTADGGETVNLRGDILPLVKLWQVFGVPGAVQTPEEGILLVVHSGGRRAALLIDEVLGNQQIVIKSLSDYLGKVDGISGCSILGDGSVSFIVDTGRLLSLVLE